MKEKLTTKAFVKKDKGKLIAVASEEVEDREGEKLSVQGWDLRAFKKNPVLLWGHNPNEPAVGRAENIRRKLVDGVKKLVFEPVFHGLSEKSALLEKLYRADPPVLTSFSVGFLPKEKEGNKYTKQELLEVSCVNVPALASATVISRMKAMGIKEKDIELLTKPYPNEHACRLESPDKFDKFRREKCAAKKNDKCIDFIYGIKAGKSKLQSMRFSKDVWDASSARSYCKSKGGSFEAASGQADTKIPKKKTIKSPSSLPKGEKKARVSEGKKEEPKGQKSVGGETRRYGTIALKALEKCFQEPKQSRLYQKVAYRAIELSLTKEFNGKKRGKKGS